MRDISTLELVHDMGIGINLGNTMEACGDWVNGKCVADYEKSWGSPLVSKEMIEGIAKEGFGVLRIPVAWSNLMVKDGTYTINAELDERIHQIVDWTIGSGMYAIINIHWDMGWVNEFPDNKDESMKRFKRMWTQIATSFQNYSDYLMFECQNEELGWEKIWNPWGGTEGKAESYALCNEINQAFVDVVRGTGGNNPKRHLLISGYNTGIDRTCDPYFKMPNDPANRMAISVHYYSPAGFAILEEDADWGKATPTWGSDQDYASLRSEMDMMKTHFTDKGIPVIIGEYGCPTKNKEPESVRRFITSVCKEAYTSRCCREVNLQIAVLVHLESIEVRHCRESLQLHRVGVYAECKQLCGLRTVGDRTSDVVDLGLGVCVLNAVACESGRFVGLVAHFVQWSRVSNGTNRTTVETLVVVEHFTTATFEAKTIDATTIRS